MLVSEICPRKGLQNLAKPTGNFDAVGGGIPQRPMPPETISFEKEIVT